MSDKPNITIELERNEWSEVTPPISSLNNSIKPRGAGLRVNLIVGVASALLGFIASDMDQDIDLDIDLEHPGLSTTARAASEELIKQDSRASGIAGFRVSVARASTTDSRTPLTANKVAYLNDVYAPIR